MGDSRLILRPLLPADYPEVYQWVQTPGVGDHWRFAHGIPSSDEFVNTLWPGTLLNSVVCLQRSGEPVGLVTAYNPDVRSGSVEVGVVQNPDAPIPGVALAGFGLFLDGLFRNWEFRYVLVETYSYSAARFGPSLRRYWSHRGTLTDHLCWDGELHDKLLYTMSREQWNQAMDGRLGRMLDRFRPLR